MKTVSPLDLQDLLSRQPQPLVIDVRTPAEFAEAHLPGALNEPLGRLEVTHFAAAQTLPKNQPFYLLCRSGQRAAQAAQRFADAGFLNSAVVEGGLLACEQAGLVIHRGAKSKVISLERQVRIGAGALVVSGVLLAYFVHPGFIALSAFVGCGLIFAGLTDWCGLGLLLAKFPWNNR